MYFEYSIIGIFFLLALTGLYKFGRSGYFILFLGMLKEKPEEKRWSSQRFAFLFTLILSNMIVWFAFLTACIIEHKIVNVPDGVITLYGVANGVTGLFKFLQKVPEKKY